MSGKASGIKVTHWRTLSPKTYQKVLLSNFFFSIFTQTKRFQKPNIEVKGAPLASAGNAPSPPACLPLSSTSLYFYCSVKLLFP